MRRSPRALVYGLLSTALLSGCGSNYTWGWYIILPTGSRGRDNIEFLLSGALYTIGTSLCAITISVLVGLAVALPGLSKYRFARRFNLPHLQTLRAVPMLVMVLWVYYGLPVLLHIPLHPFPPPLVPLPPR